MKISRTPEFYQTLMENFPYVGNLSALLSVDGWEWNSSQTSALSLFLVFKGEKRDAFDFVPQAMAQGCRVFVVIPSHEKEVSLLREGAKDALFILVDPLTFLKVSAQQVLESMPHLLKIGITGSNGKTTTKELLGSVLKSSSKKFYASSGNYNSQIGMMLSILQLKGDEEIAVFEMGISHKGEMDTLVEVLRPQYVMITTLSHAHVGHLGGLDGVVQEKVKIARYAKVLFCQKENRDLILSKIAFSGEIVSYSLKDAELSFLEYKKEGQEISWRSHSFFLSLWGEGARVAARAVLAISEYLGLSEDSLREGFREVTLPKGRMQRVGTKQGIDFLNDAYNANLSSLEVLLHFLRSNPSFFSNHCRKFFIFSGFKELGEETQKAHKEAMKSILTLSWNIVFLVGEDLKDLSIQQAGDAPIQYFEDLNSALPFFKSFFKTKDFVVLKGANSSALEKVIDLFEREA